MNSVEFKLRRATADDVLALVGIWQKAQLPSADLEKRFTEFQIVENSLGEIVGAIGLQVSTRYGNIHSETIPDFALADVLRPRLWDRLQTVAKNYGLFRFWTRENAPFWRQQGFAPPDDAARERFPEAYGDASGPWLTLKLKEEMEVSLSLDKEFELFKQSEQERTEKIFAQARALKWLAGAIAVLVFLFVIAGSLYLFKNMRR